MGQCTYCGASAGWFRTAHRECVEANLSARAEIVKLVATWLPAHPDVPEYGPLREQVMAISKRGCVDHDTARTQVREGIYAALEHFLDDGVLSHLEETHLLSGAEALGLDGPYLGQHPRAGRFVGAGVLRRVLEGEQWDKPWDPRAYGLVLASGEELLWVQSNLRLSEPKTTRSYVGSSSGVSIRVARGVYYRVGQFKGHPVDHAEVREVAVGTLALSNQQLYFVSQPKTFKVPYRKLVAVSAFEDGIAIQRDEPQRNRNTSTAATAGCCTT